MEDLNYQSWTDFYQEFADRLVTYRHRRKELVEILKAIFERLSINFPKVESDGTVDDLDPFTIFAFFNKGITNINRRRILAELKTSFNVSSPVPDSFPGIPVVMNLNATFFRFRKHRGENDINNLWEVFERALQYADHPSDISKDVFVDAYNQVKDLKGNRWKLTMGLFWIRPFTFINLDTLNRVYLAKADFLPVHLRKKIRDLSTIPDANIYLDLCNGIKSAISEASLSFGDFPQLSYHVWKDSQREKDQEREMGTKGFRTMPPLTIRYWVYSPRSDSKKWEDYFDEGIMAIGWSEIGDLRQYDSKDALRQAMIDAYGDESSHKHSVHATWQFAYEMKPGDIVYAKQGKSLIVGRGIVDSAYEFDVSQAHHHKNIRKVNWTHRGLWDDPETAPEKTLTEITGFTEYVDKLESMIREDEEEAETVERVLEYLPYGKDDFLGEVHFDEDKYDLLKNLFLTYKNVVIQGAPGTGKTYIAERLAYSIMGEKNSDRVMLVQFHQSYSYEDFIMGFRPTEDGFKLRHGTFYDFCKQAEIDSQDTPYFFIIDEINRGNLSKIFGEAFMLIEKDKRDYPVQLLYKNEKFSIPSNIYIIGLMNTADRSLALIDYALRRRFAFYDIDPVFETDSFVNYQESLKDPDFDRLIGVVKKLNATISEDSALGEGFRIGHSFFCDQDKPNAPSLSSIVEYQLIPLLKEYWFDNEGRVDEWSRELKGALK